MSRLKYVSVITASATGVAERWKSQYRDADGRWLNTSSGSSRDTYEKLCALGPDPDIAAVAEVIGNKGWSYIHCDGCGQYSERAATLGEYEAQSFCEECIDEAAMALKTARAAP